MKKANPGNEALVNVQPSIVLEKFTKSRAAWQGLLLRNLINREREWLEEAQPDTVQRYATLGKAIHNVGRLAASENLEAYIVHKNIHFDRRVRGLATIIFDQDIEQPNGRIIRGNDLDYWLTPGSCSYEEHGEIVGQLVKESQTMSGNDMFATRLPRNISLSMGFDAHMERVDDQITLRSGIPNDPFGVTRNGEPVTLWRRKGSGLPQA